MSNNHIRNCAVTGKPIEAGDRFITTPAGTYAVKSHVKLTDEQRAEIEHELFGTSFRKIVTPDVYGTDDSQQDNPQQDDAGAWTPDTPDVHVSGGTADAALPLLDTDRTDAALDASANTPTEGDSDGSVTRRGRSSR